MTYVPVPAGAIAAAARHAEEERAKTFRAEIDIYPLGGEEAVKTCLACTIRTRAGGAA